MSEKSTDAEVRKHFKGVRKAKLYEGRKSVIIWTADAKQTTPADDISLDSPVYSGRSKKKRVHVATYVPSTHATFHFPLQKHYALKKAI